MANLQWRVGDITITKLVEMELALDGGGPDSPIPDAWPAATGELPWLRPHFLDDEGRLLMSVHALLVQTPTTRLVVDTCFGNDKQRENPFWHMLGTSFLADLERAGWPRDSVDGVLCTHLHIDHVGWNTMLVGDRWVPTFPKARYYFARREFDYWAADAEAGDATEGLSDFARSTMDTRAVFEDSVRPIIDAGLATLVEMDAQIAPGVSLIPTPGHTPGHVSVLLESRGERAIISGDMMHHPCQIGRPDWPAAFDSDNKASCVTRHEFFELHADTPTLIIGTHFAGPTAGRIVREAGSYRLIV